MSDVFDPFNINDDVDQDVSFSSKTMDAFMNFESSFEAESSNKSTEISPSKLSKKLVAYSPIRMDHSMKGVDSDIFSALFQAKPPAAAIKPSTLSSVSNSLPNANKSPSRGSHQIDVTPPRIVKAQEINLINPETTNKSLLIGLHEQMHCIYDSIPNSEASIDINGTISLIPTKEVEGKTIYIAINDNDRHLREVTSYFEIAKDVSVNVCEREESKFVALKQDAGCRVFKVKIPNNLQILGSKPINLIKFSGSEILRPIPLLVTNKVRVAGSFCRVGVKIRSSPINKQDITNVIFIMAVPPDVNGESMKMSRRGGLWDPTKRVIVYRHNRIGIGETLEVQLQFNYSIDSETDITDLPRFPVLVRCDCVDDQLSSFNLQVVNAKDEQDEIDFGLQTSYQVYHRKV